MIFFIFLVIPDPNPTPGTTWLLHSAGSIIRQPTHLGLVFLEPLEILETLAKITKPAGYMGNLVPAVGQGSGISKNKSE